MAEKKRFHVTISKDSYDKIEESAVRYGVTVNAFTAIILGQWADMNDNMKNVITEQSEHFEGIFSEPDKVLSNPELMDMVNNMVKTILKEDEEFKEAAIKKIDF